MLQLADVPLMFLLISNPHPHPLPPQVHTHALFLIEETGSLTYSFLIWILLIGLL